MKEVSHSQNSLVGINTVDIEDFMDKLIEKGKLCCARCRVKLTKKNTGVTGYNYKKKNNPYGYCCNCIDDLNHNKIKTITLKIKEMNIRERNKIITKAIKLLPKEVQIFLEDNPLRYIFNDYVLVNGKTTVAKYFETPNNAKGVIIFQPHLWACSDKTIFELIIHEIAHHYIHQKYNKKLNTEREAKKLTKEWIKNKNETQ